MFICPSDFEPFIANLYPWSTWCLEVVGGPASYDHVTDCWLRIQSLLSDHILRLLSLLLRHWYASVPLQHSRKRLAKKTKDLSSQAGLLQVVFGCIQSRWTEL